MNKLINAVAMILLASGVAICQELDPARITNSRVVYASRSEVEKQPLPALSFVGEKGPVSEGIKNEIIEKIIYPLLNIMDEPIASIKVTIQHDGQEILVDTIWSNGSPMGFLVRRNQQGQIDDDAVSRFFEDDCGDGDEPER